MKKTPIVIACLMLFAAASSIAMSLGRHRGAAVIGRPLDISVQAVLDPQEDPAASCVEADVFYADTKLARSRVQVSAEKTGVGQEAVVRIRTSVAVDEPVVSIYVRAGCVLKNEKKFVVLADLISEQAPAAAVPQGTQPIVTRPSAPVAAPASAVAATPAPGPVVSDPPATRRTRSRASAAAARNAETGTVAASRPAAAVAPATPSENAPRASRAQRAKDARDAKAAAKAGARLKLEPLDLAIERDPSLRASTEMLSAPAASPQERSAAAALWRALTAQPQDILRDAEKLQGLEASVRSLQAQSQKNQLAIETLNGKVKQAESERYANVLVYALAGLLLIALAVLAYFVRGWLMLRRGGEAELPWWRKNEPLEKGWASSAPDIDAMPDEPVRPAKKAKIGRWGKTDKAPVDSAVDMDLDLGNNESGFTEVKHMSQLENPDSLPPLSRRDRADFAVSMTHPSRAVKAEELFDVQQQADFFVSLGQTEQAIEVLRGHITENVQTSALVYLDLFNLYHQLGREEDYEALRLTFNQLFNSKIPAFSLYKDKDREAGPGLEAYQAAMSRIEALWPSRKVLEIIEESIFRRPDDGSEAFDLEAYRELLMLYSVAREIIHPEASSGNAVPKFDLPESEFDREIKTTKFVSTSIQPLSASVADPAPRDSRPFLESVVPPASPNLGLDLDLSLLEAESDPLPVSAVPAVEESDSKFFEQFAADIAVPPPKSSLTLEPKPAPVSAQVPAQAPPAVLDLDNSIDFESYDSSLGLDGKPKNPKA